MKLARDVRGATGPEFAVACSVVFLLFCLVIDLGNLFAARHALSHGLDKAARYAAVRAGSASQSSVTATFRAAVLSALGPAATNECVVTVSYPTGNVIGGTVVVTATYSWFASAAMGVLPSVTLSARQALTIQH